MKNKFRKRKGNNCFFNGPGSYEFLDNNFMYQGQHLEVSSFRKAKTLCKYKNNRKIGIAIKISKQ